MNGSDIRKFWLIAFIAVYAVAVIASFMIPMIFFFWTLISMGVCVGIGEVVSVIFTGKTLSTNITKEWEKGGKKAIWCWIMCVALGLTMPFLAMHFFPW